MRPRELDVEILEAARPTRGLITRGRLAEIGVSPQSRRSLARAGLLRPVSSQVLIVAGATLGAHNRVLAAHLQAGPRSAGSHATAAGEMGFPGLGLTRPEMVLPRDAPRPRAGIGRIHRSRDLGEIDKVVIDGVPYTTPARTLLDLAPRLRPSHLQRCLRYACQQQLTTAVEVMELIEAVRRRGRPGIGRLLPIAEAALAEPQTESWLEHRYLELLAEHGIRPPETQVEVVVDGNLYRLDTLWRPEHVVAELDGQEGHASPEERQYQDERDARLRAAGFDVVHFTYADIVDRPHYPVAMTATHLALAAA